MSRSDWRIYYEKYLCSTRWKNMRRDMIRLRDGRCERCHRQAATLDLHHKTYERLGAELTSDLEVVCSVCHVEADRERVYAAVQRSEQALLAARIAGFACAKYGEDWESHVAAERVEEEFSEWLERRGNE